MGISYSVYLGAYFECKTKKITTLRTIKSCSTKDCPAYHKEPNRGEKFCSGCGNKISDVEIPGTVDVVSTYTVAVDQLGESLSSLDKEVKDGVVIHRYISNYGHGHLRYYPYEADDNKVVQEVDHDFIHGQIITLEQRHREDLAHLRKVYGLKNVDTKWGLILIAG